MRSESRLSPPPAGECWGAAESTSNSQGPDWTFGSPERCFTNVRLQPLPPFSFRPSVPILQAEKLRPLPQRYRRVPAWRPGVLGPSPSHAPRQLPAPPAVSVSSSVRSRNWPELDSSKQGTGGGGGRESLVPGGSTAPSPKPFSGFWGSSERLMIHEGQAELGPPPLAE